MYEEYPIPVIGGVRAVVTKLPAQWANIRRQPNPNSAVVNNSADVGDLRLHDVVEYFPHAKVGDWVFVKPERQSANQGWVSLQNGAVAFAPVDESGERGLTPHQYARLKAISTDLAALLEEVRPLDSGGTF